MHFIRPSNLFVSSDTQVRFPAGTEGALEGDLAWVWLWGADLPAVWRISAC